jgi:hypothetical protein
VLTDEPDLDRETTAIRSAGRSGAVVVEARNIFRAPAARFVTQDAVMVPGSRVELLIEPDPWDLPVAFEVS